MDMETMRIKVNFTEKSVEVEMNKLYFAEYESIVEGRIRGLVGEYFPENLREVRIKNENIQSISVQEESKGGS